MASGGEHSPNTMTTWTLGAIKKRDLVLEGYCQSDGCGNFFVFNVDHLIASAGADYLVPEILPGHHMQCMRRRAQGQVGHDAGRRRGGCRQRRLIWGNRVDCAMSEPVRFAPD